MDVAHYFSGLGSLNEVWAADTEGREGVFKH